MKTFLKCLRILRVIVALSVFILISVQFLDIYHTLPKSYYANNPTHTQYAPSLLRMLAGGGIVAGAAFITFSLCALVFGRVYCSFFCPFGILMDIIRRVALLPSTMFKKTRLGKFCAKNFGNLHFRKARNILRASMCAIATLAIAFGFTALFGIIDPYSLYGKIMGSVVHPATALSVNYLSTVAYAHQMYSIIPVNGDPTIPIAAFSFALLILFAIVVASALRGRIYCNTLCPVGGILGLLAKLSIFKMTLDKDTCVSCGMCERNCKAECINAKEKDLDFSKCVLCFNCSDKCPKGAIKYKLNKKLINLFSKKTEKNASSNQRQSASQKELSSSITRRSFPAALATITTLFCSAAKKEARGKDKEKSCAKLEAIDAKCGEPTPYGIKGERSDKRLTLPPGAGTLENYLEHCTGCQICTAACKAQILKPSLGEWGLAGFMQPYMDFDSGFCLHTCHNCSKACPTGAIKFVGGKDKRRLKIGTAIFRKDLCVVKTDGTDCAACAEHCPVQAIEMIPFGNKENRLYIPYVHEEVCIGCGACEHICPVRPHRAIVIRGLAKQTKAKEFNESMSVYRPELPKKIEVKQSDAFPF